jgi:antitoxin (DNA-binding transcriptional repressor) of toxin-antitoxin stability system
MQLMYKEFVQKGVSAMAIVSVSDRRQHLPAFLKRVQAGEELQVTSRGPIIARIAPERDPADEARQWLLNLRDRASAPVLPQPSTKAGKRVSSRLPISRCGSWPC